MLGFLECAAYALVPSLLGWLWELSVGVSGFLSTLITLLLLTVWYWAGWRYAVRIRNPIAALLAGNSIGLLSLGIYLWQEYGAAVKNVVLQGLSQKYGASLTMITVRIVMRFSPVVDGVTQVSNTALQIVAFLLLAALFAVGYFSHRKILKEAK